LKVRSFDYADRFSAKIVSLSTPASRFDEPHTTDCITVRLLSLGTIPWAQKDAASIVGTVQDPSAAVVPKAEVRVMDVDRGTTFATSTGGSGDYVASPLKIGHYTVTVRKKISRPQSLGR